jgi:hypothetical protein
VNGRAVAAAGDSVYAFTAPGAPGIFVVPRDGGDAEIIGADALQSPVQVQELAGHWYVSDVENGQPFLVILSSSGAVVRRLALDTIASAPHQFAALPDGRVVVEAPDGRLVALSDTGVATFALTSGQPAQTGLVVAGHGGALHAVPDRDITLYNENGNIRWRLEWPWDASAFVTDVAVDAQGRFHVIAGQEGRDTFVVFMLSPTTGEILRWSEPGPYATFVVTRLGKIQPDSAGRWVGTAGSR